MPTYVYETLPTDGQAIESFEVRQRMSDPPLTVHPTTGVPVKRVLTAPFIGGRAGVDVPESCPVPSMGGGCGSGMCGGGGCALN